MSPVLTQRVAGTPSGIPGAIPNCQLQAPRSGSCPGNTSRDSPAPSGSSPAGIRRAAEQMVVPAFLPSAVADSRADNVDGMNSPPSPSAAIAAGEASLKSYAPTSADAGVCDPGAAASAHLVQPFQPTADRLCCGKALQEDSTALLESAGDIAHDSLAATTFIPMMRAPPSPTHSSAPCSPASSVVLSGAYRSSVTSATYRSSMACAFTTNASLASASVSRPPCASGSVVAAANPADGCGSASGSDSGCPLVDALLGPSDAFRQCFPDNAPAPSIQRRGAMPPPPQRVVAAADMHLQRYCDQPVSREGDAKAAAGSAAAASGGAAALHLEGDVVDHCGRAAGGAATAGMPPLSVFTTASLSGCSSRRSSLRDQNSVTIKAATVVKDAAGAIDKILSRGVTALVTALRSGGPPYNTSYDSLNQAVKAIAVARQYAKETGPEGAEVTFLPFHRYDSNERPDPSRFAFLVFPVPHLDERLKTVDETVLNVARGSDIHKMASAIIAVMLDRGQAVMKAAGSEAIFVAMSAVVNARHRLIQKHGFDLMLAAAWITEDTMSTMGRESKFLRFNVLKTEPAGPKSGVLPTLPAMLEAC